MQKGDRSECECVGEAGAQDETLTGVATGSAGAGANEASAAAGSNGGSPANIKRPDLAGVRSKLGASGSDGARVNANGGEAARGLQRA